MEQIATAYESKDSVLGSIFDIEDSIRQSDQGKSFFAFWQILTDAQKNEKLSTMLEKLYDIEIIQEFDSEERLKNLKYDLLLNADKIGKISSKLIEQLRRFLDDRVWIENKKILELCNAIEKKAVEIKENPPLKRDFHHLAKNKVAIDSVFEKSLYTLKENKAFSHEIKEDVLEVNLDDFYDIFFIDEALLQNNINYFLQIQSQCTLVEVLEKFPIEKGISELIGYLSLAKNSKNSIVSPDEKQKIHILGEDGNKKIVSVAKILFTKGTS